MDARMIAHDMRTPLNALQLSLQAAMPLVGDSGAKEILKLAEKNSHVLAGMIESLLASAREGPFVRGSLALRTCQAADLVRDAVDQVALQAREKVLKLEVKSSLGVPPFVADGERLMRVLVNLLTNAIKFTPTGGLIEVEYKLRVNDGHPVVVFSVTDDGVGVSEEDAQRIFVEGISIAAPENRSHGLGLAVCKEIVEAHDGRIWVELGRPQGSTFSFSVPADAAVE